MANNQIEGQKVLDETRVLTTVEHGGPSNDSTFQLDQSATSILAVTSRNGGTAPTATLGTASGGLKTVTLTGGRSGKCDVISQHLGGIGGFQPSSAPSESG